jgi:hypothetical protein
MSNQSKFAQSVPASEEDATTPGTVFCRLADGSVIETTLTACQNTPGAEVVSKRPTNTTSGATAASAGARKPTDHVICRLADGSEIETTRSACENTPDASVVGNPSASDNVLSNASQ